MTDDTGFAPNPFWRVLTLATCKFEIRLTKEIGDWIAGFTSNKLCSKKKHGKKLCDHPALVGEEKLIYLMQVEEKINFADYFRDPRFASKIPKKDETQCIYRTGDNIYKPKCPIPFNCDDFEQLCNPNHNESHKEDDLRGKFVLVSKKFYYFGKGAIAIHRNLRPKIPRCCAKGGWQTHDQTLAQNFINFIVNG